MLNPDSDPTAPNELGFTARHLKTTWIALKRGQRKFSTADNYYQMLADVEAKFLQWLKELQPPPQEHPAAPFLVPITVREEIMKRLQGGLGWDKFMQDLRDSSAHKAVQEADSMPSETIADTSAPSEESEGGTEAKLTYWKAAYFLAYKRIRITDPRASTDKSANEYALKLCGLNSGSSGWQLFDKYRRLISPNDRNTFFNSAVDSFNSGDKFDKTPQALLKDIETIIPLLEGENKSEAESDLKRWNTTC